MLSKEESAGMSGLAVISLRFGFGERQFLWAFAGYKDWAAVFEVFFNLEKIHFFWFLNFNVFVVIFV